MAWSKSRAENRIKERKEKKNDYFVVDHNRDKDFLSMGNKEIRRVDGIHHYFDISNFPKLVSEAKEDEQKQKKLLQKAHVFAKGLDDLIDQSISTILQDQNLRKHFLRTKPYTDKTEMAKKAIIEAINLNSFVYDAFNEVFDEDNFRARSGMALGITYIANIGKNGSRELISLGSAANYGAKLLNNDGSVCISEELYNNLIDELKEIFEKDELSNGITFYLTKQAKWSQLPSLKEKLKINFDKENIKKKLTEYKDGLPLSEINLSDANGPIEFNSLTERNAKRTHTISIVADIDGFTKYIEEAEDEDKLVKLFGLFSGIREEIHDVVSRDYDGIVIQHRGDATYSVLNLPSKKDEKKERCNDGTSIALALQSSMKLLNNEYSEYDDLLLSIGVGSGLTLYSRVGKQGKKHDLVIGKGNEESEELQKKTEGKNTSVSKAIYKELDSDLEELFEENESMYTAFDKCINYNVEEETERLKKNLEVNVSEKNISISISSKNRQPEVNTGPWHP